MLIENPLDIRKIGQNVYFLSLNLFAIFLSEDFIYSILRIIFRS